MSGDHVGVWIERRLQRIRGDRPRVVDAHQSLLRDIVPLGACVCGGKRRVERADRELTERDRAPRRGAADDHRRELPPAARPALASGAARPPAHGAASESTATTPCSRISNSRRKASSEDIPDMSKISSIVATPSIKEIKKPAR